MCDSNKKKKSKAVSPEQQMLTTDAAPVDGSQILSNGTQLRNENIPPQTKTESNRNEKIEQMDQNYRNHCDQNASMIGTLQNLTINHCGTVHIGSNIYHGQCSNSGNDSCDGNNGNQGKEMSKTVTGTQ